MVELGDTVIARRVANGKKVESLGVVYKVSKANKEVVFSARFQDNMETPIHFVYDLKNKYLWNLPDGTKFATDPIKLQRGPEYVLWQEE